MFMAKHWIPIYTMNAMIFVKIFDIEDSVAINHLGLLFVHIFKLISVFKCTASCKHYVHYASSLLCFETQCCVNSEGSFAKMISIIGQTGI